jgi:hypothetical protein
MAVKGYLQGRKDAAEESARNQPIKPPLRAKVNDKGEAQVSVAEKEQTRIGLKTTDPKLRRVQKQIRAYGSVLDISALTTLSNNYAAAAAQVKIAEARLAASKPAAERATSLLKSHAGSEAQAQIAEATYQSDKAGSEAAQSQQRALEASASQDWGGVLGKAIIEHDAIVTRLIERRAFLLQITFPASAAIAPPASAVVEAPGAAKPFDANYLSPATRTDPKIQGPSYFYLANADSGILPGMNVLATLPAGEKYDAFAVPRSALVWWSGRTWIYEKTSDDDFVRREVHTDGAADKNGDLLIATKDLPSSDPEIVTTGAQLLLSEEFRSDVQVGGDND